MNANLDLVVLDERTRTQFVHRDESTPSVVGRWAWILKYFVVHGSDQIATSWVRTQEPKFKSSFNTPPALVGYVVVMKEDTQVIHIVLNETTGSEKPGSTCRAMESFVNSILEDN